MSVFTFCFIIFLQIVAATLVIVGFLYEERVIDFEQRLWKKMKRYFGGMRNETV